MFLVTPGRRGTEYHQSKEQSERICQAVWWQGNKKGVKRNDMYNTCVQETSASGNQRRGKLMSVCSDRALHIHMKLIG